MNKKKAFSEILQKTVSQTSFQTFDDILFSSKWRKIGEDKQKKIKTFLAWEDLARITLKNSENKTNLAFRKNAQVSIRNHTIEYSQAELIREK